MGKIIIGADGGGTGTKLAACDETGNILETTSCGGINYNNKSMSICRQNLKKGVDSLLKKIGADDFDILSIGHPSLDKTATEKEKSDFCGNVFDSDKVIMESDVHMALEGAIPAGEAGIMIVSGTGSMCVGRNNSGEVAAAGGWGHLFCDEGSCYHIAWSGITKAIHEWECGGKPTLISLRLFEFYDISDHRKLIDRIYNSRNKIADIAAFAKEIINCSREGDLISTKIISDALDVLIANCSYLAEKLNIKSGTIRIYGGLFEYNADIYKKFCKKIKKKLTGFSIGVPEYPPEIGAVLFFLKQKNNDALSEKES